MTQIKAVIFDLDGTLLHSIADIAEANNEMLRSFGYPVHDLKKYIGWIGNGASELVEKSLPTSVQASESIDKYLQLYKQNYRKQLCVKTHLYPKINVLLDYLSNNNIPMAINTNKPDTLTQTLVENYFNQWDFKLAIGQSEKFPHKPNPSAALHIAEQLNISSNEIVFVGDSYVDMQTAMAAKMIPLGVSYGYGNPTRRSDEAYTIVDDALDVIHFINKNNKAFAEMPHTK